MLKLEISEDIKKNLKVHCTEKIVHLNKNKNVLKKGTILSRLIHDG